MQVASLSAHLTRLLAIVFLPLALFATAVLVYSDQTQRRESDARLIDTAAALALALDQTLAVKQAAVSTLAQSAYRLPEEAAAFHDYASRVARQNDSWIVVFERGGAQLLNTRVPFGTPLPGPGRSSAEVAKVFDTGLPTITNVFEGQVTPGPIVSVYVPLRDAEQVRYVLGMGTHTSQLSELLSRFVVPEGFVAVAIDGNGRVVGRSRGEDMVQGTMGRPWILDRIGDRDRGIVEGEPREGQKARGAFARMAKTSWTVAIIEPADRPAARAAVPIVAFVAAGTLLFLGLLTFAGSQARRLAKSVTEAATGSLRSVYPTPPRTAGPNVATAWAVALVAVALAVLVRWLLEAWVDASVPFITLFPAVVLAVWFGGFGPAMFAAVTGYAATNYLFIEPRFAFGLARPEDQVSLVLYLFATALIAWMGSRMRAAELAEARRATEAQGGAKLLRTLLDEVPAGITICGAAPDFPVLAFSRQVGALLGEDALRKLLGSRAGVHDVSMGLRAADGAAMSAEHSPLYRAVSEGVTIAEHDAQLLRPGERARAIRVSAVPVRDSKGSVVGGIEFWYDVTDMKDVEARLRESDERKDAFLATLAHELRNPLGVATNAIELIDRTRARPAETIRLAALGRRHLQQLTRLVNDLLDLSRINHGKIGLVAAPIRVDDVLAEALEASQPGLDSAGVSLTVQHADADAWIHADRARMVQVFSNLIANCARYTPRGGHAWIRTTLTADEVTVSVQDTGIGIPRDWLERVFEPFRQAGTLPDRVAEGLGIGLTLVRQLVEIQGGRVKAESDGPGRGSTFSVTLPRIAPPADVASTAGGATGVAAEREVIVADDNVDAAETTAMILRMAGHRVSVAHDGVEAVRLAEARRPHALIVDLGMPGMDGNAVARRIRADPRTRTAVLIALTGWGMDVHRRETAASGFDHHLVKPVDPDELLSLVTGGR